MLIMAGVKLVSQTVGTANITEWAKLALSDLRARVLRVTRLRHDDQDRPVVLEMVVLVLDWFPGLETSGDATLDIAELARRYGLQLARATERASIVPASAEIASHLATGPGTNVVKLDRVAETAQGVPVEWRVAFSKG